MKKQLFALALLCSMSFLQGSDDAPKWYKYFNEFIFITNEQLNAVQSSCRKTFDGLKKFGLSTSDAAKVARETSITDALDSHNEWFLNQQAKSASGVSSSAIDQFVATSPKSVELTADDKKGIEQIISNNKSGVQSLASRPAAQSINLSSPATWALNNQATLFGLGSFFSGTGAVVAARSENTSAAVGLGLLSALSAYGSYATNQFYKNWNSRDKNIEIYKSFPDPQQNLKIKRQLYAQDLYKANTQVPGFIFQEGKSVATAIFCSQKK